MNNSKEKKLAYLISMYPAVSCTFISREITNLRALGFNINVASINETNIAFKNLTRVEKEEIKDTLYVKKEGFFKAFSDMLKTLFSFPLTFFKTVVFCIGNGGFNLRKIFFNLCYLIEACIVGQWMKRKHIQHLHVHFANPASFVALLTSKLFHTSYSITVHGPDEFENVNYNSLKEKIEEASFICCIGYFARSQLMKISDPQCWSKFEITPMGVDSIVYTNKNIPHKSSEIRILNIGRLVSAKGQLTLITAINKLIKGDGHNIHLTIVGDGPELEQIKNLINTLDLTSNITLTGALNQLQIIDLYNKTDIFVLSSFAEGIPIVLMEAMSMKIPVIATCINGIPELIDHNVNGLLVSPSNEIQMAQSIKRLIEFPSLREQLGQAAREKIEKKYNLNPNVLHLGKVFANRITVNIKG